MSLPLPSPGRAPDDQYARLGLTQPEAAKRLGVSRRTLQRYIETALSEMALALAEPDT
jgi:predicted DNA-binding protein (UPF0251 family)